MHSKIISNHERIALQLSGGRDSIACLYLMREHLDKITVYWCNTGAAYPETIETIEHARKLAPNFVEVEGRQPQVIQQFGIPTDILPASCTPMGAANAGGGVLMQDRYTCCLRSIMFPLHEAMIRDGITLIIRGQRNDDQVKGTLKSGDVDAGIEYLFPIEEWTASDVMDYLRAENAPIPRFYETLHTAPDCMTCSAYWEDGVAGYLKQYHPEQYQANQGALDVIRDATRDAIENFNRESST